jgi:hypothetical protein
MMLGEGDRPTTFVADGDRFEAAHSGIGIDSA